MLLYAPAGMTVAHGDWGGLPVTIGPDVAGADTFHETIETSHGFSSSATTQDGIVMEANELLAAVPLTADDKLLLRGGTARELTIAAVACITAKAKLVVPEEFTDEAIAASAGEEQVKATYDVRQGAQLLG